MTREEADRARQRAAVLLHRAGIALTPAEIRTMEVADFGLENLSRYGLEIVTYVNSARYCAKEIILFPGQICPEHFHPPLSEKDLGKQETFRCRWGTIYLHVPGEPTLFPKASVPPGDEAYFSAPQEIVLHPGDQYTLPPNTLHWFQAGDDGAVLSEFSSASVDEKDVWTDRRIKRTPVYS
jgi:D-lyxose ketol-isomerase